MHLADLKNDSSLIVLTKKTAHPDQRPPWFSCNQTELSKDTVTIVQTIDASGKSSKF